MSFHFRGKTKKGASKWVGSWTAPPRWFGLLFAGYGLVAGSAGLLGLLYGLLMGYPPGLSTLVLVGLIHFLAFGGTGYWMLSMRRRILSLNTSEQLCKRLSIDEATLESVAEAKNIRPIYNINGVDYYDPAEFGDSMTLLRGTVAPAASPESLLRAAVPTDSQTPADQLLRAAETTHEASDG